MRARVDDLAAFGHRIGNIPIRHRVLALQAMRDVGIVSEGITRGQRLTHFRNGQTCLRAEHDAIQPLLRVLLTNDLEELVHPGRVEALR